jgi:hypothetical protein
MIADRCWKPDTDLLSELIQTGIEGEELTIDDLRAIVAALVFRPASSATARVQLVDATRTS